MNSKELQYNTENIKSIFLEFLDHNNIAYILLSEYFGAKGGDIDIYILPNSYKIYIELINQTNLYKQKYIPDYENHFFYYYNIEGYRPLRVHVKYELSFFDNVDNVYRHASFEKEIENNLLKIDSGCISRHYLALLLYASKCAFLEKYKLELRQIESLRTYIDKFLKEISDSKEREVILKIQDIINNIQDEKNLVQLSLRLREILLPYFQNVSKGKTFKKIILNKFKRFGKSKFSVLFLGPDGAGKTTTIEFVKKELDLPISTLYGGLGLNGWIFTSLYTLRESNKKANRIRRALVNRIIAYILYPMELLARTIRSSFSAKRNLLLIDRSPELLIKTKLINRLHDYVFPVPSLVVLLKAPAGILVERKPDELNFELASQKLINEEELARFYEKKGAKIIYIDTSITPLEESKIIIEKEIWNCEKFKTSLFETNRYKNDK